MHRRHLSAEKRRRCYRHSQGCPEDFHVLKERHHDKVNTDRRNGQKVISYPEADYTEQPSCRCRDQHCCWQTQPETDSCIRHQRSRIRTDSKKGGVAHGRLSRISGNDIQAQRQQCKNSYIYRNRNNITHSIPSFTRVFCSLSRRA